MGKISQGVLGGFSGKVGNIIGGSWKGIDYMRIKAANVSNPNTQGQLDQRSKFAIVLNFLQTMTGFIRTGFKNYAIKMTQFNAAMSYNLSNAITGAYPNFTIDFPNVLVTRGNLIGVLNGRVHSLTQGEVSVEWDDNHLSGDAGISDTPLVLLYNVDKGVSLYKVDLGERGAEGLVVEVPNDYTGDTVHVYLGFLAEDGGAVSNSSYLGTVVVA